VQAEVECFIKYTISIGRKEEGRGKKEEGKKEGEEGRGKFRKFIIRNSFCFTAGAELMPAHNHPECATPPSKGILISRGTFSTF